MGVSFGPTKIQDSAGTVLSGATKTADFDTQWLSMSGARKIGFAITMASTGGTSPTFDFDLEWSPDGGTTVFQTPMWSFVSDTSATSDIYNIAMDIPQLTADGNHGPYWFDVSWVPSNKNSRVRLECTTGGTSETAAFTIWYFGRD